MDELLSSPLGVLVLARSIIEVSGVPPAMRWGEELGRYPIDDLATCLVNSVNVRRFLRRNMGIRCEY
jgi:hypothetical protein